MSTQKIDRKYFFDSIHSNGLFPILKQSQVDGMEVILSYWEQTKFEDLRWLAYMLSTTKRETGSTMQPIKEWGGNTYFITRYWLNKVIRNQLGNRNSSDAILYPGRGDVQISGYRNYELMGRILGVDLVNHPEKALEPQIAVRIMFEGMTTSLSLHGDFTGRSLEQYFNLTTNNPLGARAIVNGKDHAQEIADNHYKFLSALKYISQPLTA